MSNAETIVENSPIEPIHFEEDERLDGFVQALATALDELDSRIETRRENLFVETATGADLEQLATVVGVKRQTGESDERLRSRVQANFGRATSNATVGDFAAIAATVLDADPSQFEIDAPDNRPAVILFVDTNVLDGSLLSNSELVELLSDTVPAAHAVELNGIGSFRFDGAGYTPPSGSGFGNGTFGLAER